MTREDGPELVIDGEPLRVNSISFQKDPERQQRSGMNTTYSGSFTFEIDEENFPENADLLAALGVQILRINGEPYIVSEAPYSRTDELEED